MDRARGGGGGAGAGAGAGSSNSNTSSGGGSGGSAAGSATAQAQSRRRTLPPSSSSHSFPNYADTRAAHPAATSTHSNPAAAASSASSSPSSSSASTRLAAAAASTPSKNRIRLTTTSMARAGEIAENISPSRTPRSEKAPKPSNLSHSFTFSTPSPTMASRGLNARKRSQTFEFDADGTPHDDSLSKGGHTLRRRTRIDYSHIEQDDEAESLRQEAKGVIASVGQRGRKRKPTFSFADDEPDGVVSHAVKKPRLSRPRETSSPASVRRKPPAKKPVEDNKVFADDSSEHDVKDTIEVGVTYEDESDYSEEQSSFNQSESSKSSADHNTTEQAEQAAMISEQPAQAEPKVPRVSEPVKDTTEKAADKPDPPAADASPVLEAVLEVKPPASKDEAEVQHEKNAETADPTDTPQRPTWSVSANGTVLHFIRINPPPSKSLTTSNKPTPPATTVTGNDDKEVDLPQKNHSNGSRTTIDEASPAHRTQSREPSSSPVPVAIAALDHASTPPPITSTDQLAVSDPETPNQDTAEAQVIAEATSAQSSRQKDADLLHAQAVQAKHSPPPEPSLAAWPHDKAESAAAIDKVEPSSPINHHPVFDDQPPSPKAQPQDGPTKEDHETTATGEQPQESPGELRRSSRRRKSTVKMGFPTGLNVEETSPTSNKTATRSSQKDASQQLKRDKSKTVQQSKDDPFPNFTPYVDGTTYLPELAEESSVPTPNLSIDQNGDGADESAEAAQVDVQDSIEDHQGVVDMDALSVVGSDIVTPNGETPTLSPAVEDRNGADSVAPGSTPLLTTGTEDAPHRRSRKQFPFNKLRDAEEIADALADFKEMKTDDLYAALAAANDILVSWRDEWITVKKVTDDEDNAVRRRQHDLAYENKTAQALKKNNPELEVVEKDFVIKGIRLKDGNADPGKARQKLQDKLMSEIYLFEHDPRDALVGKQDPDLQRDGLANSRLRNRPRQTAKAAEAEVDPEATGPGKRTRKRKMLSDESRDASRAGTPVAVPPPTRRRRRGPNAKSAALIQDEVETDAETIAADDMNGDAPPLPPPVSLTKHGKRRGRPPGSGKSQATQPQPQPQPTSASALAAGQPKQTRRKRKRANKANDGKDIPPIPAYMAEQNMDQPESAQQSKRPRINFVQSQNGNKPGEIASGSFYTQTSVDSAGVAYDSRPSSSGSDGTVDTVESNYSLRRKKRRNFKEEEEQAFSPVQPVKRRRVNKAQPAVADRNITPNYATAPGQTLYGHDSMQYQTDYAPMPGPMYHQFPANHHHIPLAPAPLSGVHPKPKPVKFKHFNSNPGHPSGVAPMPSPTSTSLPGSGPSSRVQTPAPAQHIMLPAGGGPSPASADNGAESEKDYTQMTKSEKMSHSMKTRWANGSMQAAVAKRKATLAAKKALAAQQASATVPAAAGGQPVVGTPLPSGAPTPTPGPSTSSAEATPVPTIGPGFF